MESIENSLFGGSWPIGVFVIGTFLIHEVTFVIGSAVLAAIDYYNICPKSKIQKAKYPEGKLLKRCLKQLAFNHFVLNPLGLPVLYFLAGAAGVRMTSPLPSWREMVPNIVICIIVEDTLFYWTHRLLHLPPLYRRFHKKHHQFYTPIGMAAEYAHPVEYLLSNSLPFFAGPLLTGCHLLTMWIWLFIRTVETLDGHSGYDFWWMPFRYFPFRPGPAIHDFHHSHNLGNYGSFFQFWDWICGTDKAYKKYTEQMKSVSEEKR